MNGTRFTDDRRREHTLRLLGTFAGTALLVLPGIWLLLRVTLIDEPITSPLVIGVGVTTGVTAVVRRFRLAQSVRFLLVWGGCSGIVVVLFGWASTTATTRLSGTDFYTLRALSIWIAATAFGWAIASTVHQRLTEHTDTQKQSRRGL